MRGRSLSGRLASALGIIAALSVAGTALITFGLVRQYAEQQALAQLNGSTVQGTVTVPRGTFVYVAQPVPGRRPNGVAGVVLARPVGLAATVWRPVIGRVLLAGAVAVLVAVAVSLWIARRLAEPLRKMAEATTTWPRATLPTGCRSRATTRWPTWPVSSTTWPEPLPRPAGASMSSSPTSRTSSAHH